jgi:hypothetical protein
VSTAIRIPIDDLDAAAANRRNVTAMRAAEIKPVDLNTRRRRAEERRAAEAPASGDACA